jgi:hypothetical protein
MLIGHGNDAAMNRLIDLEGCLNFRDLGGYPTDDGRHVCWRRVFRSDALHLLSAADVVRLRDELGLSDVVDLRSSAERRGDPRRPLEELSIRHHHAPLFDGDSAASERRAEVEMVTARGSLLGLAEFAKPVIGRVVTLIAESRARASTTARRGRIAPA